MVNRQKRLKQNLRGIKMFVYIQLYLLNCGVNKIKYSSRYCFVIFLFLIVLPASSYAQLHPAELKIENKSERKMEIKVIELNKNNKLTQVTISARNNVTIPIHETGKYYLKVKAIYPNREPIYSKGNPFEVYVGYDGYSVLTISYSVNESSLDPLSGKTISKEEFEKD